MTPTVAQIDDWAGVTWSRAQWFGWLGSARRRRRAVASALALTLISDGDLSADEIEAATRQGCKALRAMGDTPDLTALQADLLSALDALAERGGDAPLRAAVARIGRDDGRAALAACAASARAIGGMTGQEAQALRELASLMGCGAEDLARHGL